MLSPHEFATLMLVKDATEQLEVDRADLDVLLSRQLVSLEHAPSGQALPLDPRRSLVPEGRRTDSLSEYA